MSLRSIGRALLSVSDKTGLLEFAQQLSRLGIALISTGGTRQLLAAAGLAVRDVSDVTGFAEMLDGRVKTLHPRIHGGILAIRDRADHQATLRQHGIEPIDLVVCNLYPFQATLAKPGSSHEEIIETIDVGGPSLVRAAAKNYRDVAVVTAPHQYAAVAQELEAHHGALTLETRQRLAAAAFALTAAYDQAIAAYLARRSGGAAEPFPDQLELAFHKKQALRYGENPHQTAAFYVEPGLRRACVATAEVLHGKELSFNNILDLDSALNLVRDLPAPAAVVVKHNNPCGAAVGTTLAAAFERAYDGDPISAFGGILAFNGCVDEATAVKLTEPNRFFECLIAPDYSARALEIITTRPTWKKSVRLLRTGALDHGPAAALDYRRVEGGLLVQTTDTLGDELAQATTVTRRAPTDAERRDLALAWIVAKHVKSNAIVLAKDGMVVGVGAGQMSRIDATHLAARKAGDRAAGSVLASDAFFPFRDNVDLAAQCGVTAIIQPGGSVRDQESIDACNASNLAMLFTGRRHFRH
ncbi:MAG: bifunctional phosphoribosylaminoimidazolecarboxamide formyltransferase/IMP cyclohydrolase [Gemmataceae bacterium]|nr:bifunctional phosphoribosylaminoimidazolecarboxamide formyltransferase/IMP cyclohydrolase [Gemmataceae bacterium]